MNTKEAVNGLKNKLAWAQDKARREAGNNLHFKKRANTRLFDIENRIKKLEASQCQTK